MRKNIKQEPEYKKLVRLVKAIPKDRRALLQKLFKERIKRGDYDEGNIRH